MAKYPPNHHIEQVAVKDARHSGEEAKLGIRPDRLDMAATE